MFRSKDFLLMEVMNVVGEKLGYIDDILIDFNLGFIRGFSISSYKIFSKNIYVLKNDIVSFNSNMIIKKYIKEESLKFLSLKGMDVIDTQGNVMGIMEDVIFDKCTFEISGIIVSRGFISNCIYGKRIFLIKDLILGEKNILYCKKKDDVDFKTIPHTISGETI